MAALRTHWRPILVVGIINSALPFLCLAVAALVLRQRVARGFLVCALAGCSAGAMALGGYVPDFRHPKRGGTEGLGVG